MTRLRSAAITTTPATSLRATASRIASSIADGWNGCAPAANGKAATLPQRVMNSRRFIGSSSLWHREGSLADAERRYHADARGSTMRTHRARKKLGRIACPHAARQFNGTMPTSDLRGYRQAGRGEGPEDCDCPPASGEGLRPKIAFGRISGTMGRHKELALHVLLPLVSHRVSRGRQGAAAHDCVTRPNTGAKNRRMG